MPLRLLDETSGRRSGPVEASREDAGLEVADGNGDPRTHGQGPQLERRHRPGGSSPAAPHAAYSARMQPGRAVPKR
ncbi:hypothetical protein GCM10010273_55840 [Streptomyces lavendulocolor]